jgi:hypothetical protein
MFCPDAVAAFGWRARGRRIGAVAQLGEHLLCKQGVSGSIPLSSTKFCADAVAALPLRSARAAEQSAWSSGPVWWKTEYPNRENKVCIGLTGLDACSDYIVKRRYVWKLPGVLSNSYEFLGMSEPSLIETMDDLADRIWWRDWR